MSRTVKRKPKLPRAPLPKQKGGAHRTHKDEPHRKRKHKKQEFTYADALEGGFVNMFRYL